MPLAYPVKKSKLTPHSDKYTWKQIKAEVVAHFKRQKPAQLLHSLIAETLYRDSQNHIRMSQTTLTTLLDRNHALLSAANCLDEDHFNEIVAEVFAVLDEYIEIAKERVA